MVRALVFDVLVVVTDSKHHDISPGSGRHSSSDPSGVSGLDVASWLDPYFTLPANARTEHLFQRCSNLGNTPFRPLAPICDAWAEGIFVEITEERPLRHSMRTHHGHPGVFSREQRERLVIVLQ